MSNKTVADQFYQIAALLAEQGVAFKPAAYRRAAQTIEELDTPLADMPMDVAELKKIPTIGEAIARKIIEYFETGEIQFLVKLQREQGGISPELMDIEGLGPKRARQIQTELGISTVDELVKAAKEHKLQALERFDELLEQQILEHALRVEERNKRFNRAEVADDVEALLKAIQKLPAVDKASVAGSYRRHKPTVGDIDILVVTASPQSVSDAVAGLSLVRNVIAHGDKKVSFDMHSGLRVDVRFVAAEQWGSALLYFTGSKDHNIAMRKVAIKQGWKLNEYGLFDGEELLASETEEDIYAKLGLQYHEPTQRDSELQFA